MNVVGAGLSAGNLYDAVPLIPPGQGVKKASVDTIDPRFVITQKELIKGKKVGEGSYGWVYRGTWRDMEVAIKEINLREEQAANQLLIEAAGMQNLRPHGNIVTLYGICAEPIAIVTEFCERGSLDDLLYGKRPFAFSDDEIRKIILGAAKGVNHLHQEGIVHRDLAARNVLVDAQIVAKIADFGN